MPSSAWALFLFLGWAGAGFVAPAEERPRPLAEVVARPPRECARFAPQRNDAGRIILADCFDADGALLLRWEDRNADGRVDAYRERLAGGELRAYRDRRFAGAWDWTARAVPKGESLEIETRVTDRPGAEARVFRDRVPFVQALTGQAPIACELDRAGTTESLERLAAQWTDADGRLRARLPDRDRSEDIRIADSCPGRGAIQRAMGEALEQGAACLKRLGTDTAWSHLAKMRSTLMNGRRPLAIECGTAGCGSAAAWGVSPSSGDWPKINLCRSGPGAAPPATLFHELFHNLDDHFGHAHTAEPDYVVACETCCFGAGDDRGYLRGGEDRQYQCEVCGGGVSSARDAKYLVTMLSGLRPGDSGDLARIRESYAAAFADEVERGALDDPGALGGGRVTAELAENLKSVMGRLKGSPKTPAWLLEALEEARKGGRVAAGVPGPASGQAPSRSAFERGAGEGAGRGSGAPRSTGRRTAASGEEGLARACAAVRESFPSVEDAALVSEERANRSYPGWSEIAARFGVRWRELRSCYRAGGGPESGE